MKNKKLLIKIIIAVVIVLILIVGGILTYQYIKNEEHKKALLALREYERMYYKPTDFIYEEENSNIFLVETNQDYSVNLITFDENYNQIMDGKLVLGEEPRYPVYVGREEDGYFMLFANKDASEKPFMYAVKVNNALEEVWKTKIDLEISVEELLGVVRNQEGTYTFYMAFVNGTRAKNNLIRIDKDGNIILNKPFEDVTTGSLVDLYENNDEIGIVVKSNVGSDEARHIKLSTRGYKTSEESGYKKPTDKEDQYTLTDGKIIYGSKDKKAYISKVDSEGKEIWKNEIEKKLDTRVGEINKVYKLSNGNILAIYLEYPERTDFRIERMNDLYNVNNVIIYSPDGKKIKEKNLIKLLGAKYSPIKFGVDTNDNLYVYSYTSQYTSVIAKLDSNLTLNKKIELEETTIPRFVSFSNEGNIYYSDLNKEKTMFTMRKAKPDQGKVEVDSGMDIYNESEEKEDIENVEDTNQDRD